MADIGATVGLRVIGRLFNQLQEQLIEESVPTHSTLDNPLSHLDEVTLTVPVIIFFEQTREDQNAGEETAGGAFQFGIRNNQQGVGQRDSTEGPIFVAVGFVALCSVFLSKGAVLAGTFVEPARCELGEGS